MRDWQPHRLRWWLVYYNLQRVSGASLTDNHCLGCRELLADNAQKKERVSLKNQVIEKKIFCLVIRLMDYTYIGSFVIFNFNRIYRVLFFVLLYVNG